MVLSSFFNWWQAPIKGRSNCFRVPVGRMASHSFVLRERKLAIVFEKEMQCMEENRKVVGNVVMFGVKVVMYGAYFLITKKGRLMGRVFLPKAEEGLEVKGKFTMKSAGAAGDSEVELMQLAGGKVMRNVDKNVHGLIDERYLEEVAVYKMEVGKYSQEFREKYLKTSQDKDPHYEIQIDVEVSRGRKKLPQARKDSLVKDISRLLEDKGTSDMVIECDGELVPCHRAVLAARSATFAGGLGNDFVEKKEGKWKVEDSSLGAVKDMLSFIYTGRAFLRDLGEVNFETVAP